MRFGVFLVILHSQFSILNLLVTGDDFAKAAGVAKVMVRVISQN
jgi:ABC-type Fe3+-siderophore transport system permease subunit